MSLRDGELETRIGPLLPALLDQIEREPDGDELGCVASSTRPSTTCTSTGSGCADEEGGDGG